MPQTTDIAIVGGGVIGTSIAYYLSRLGIKSTVFEQSRFGSGASGATAGVVGPLWHLDPANRPLFDMGLRSLDMFPGLVASLVEEGLDPEFRQTGILKLAFAPDEVKLLHNDLAWQGELGRGVRWVDAAEVIDREPQVNPQVLGGVYSPQEGSINGRRYVRALVQAAARHGATFHEETEVLGLVTEGSSVTGVKTAAQTYHAGHTVLAAGYWTGIADRWVPEVPPVKPEKGQRILLRQTGLMPRCAVSNFIPGYLIPQVDGDLLATADIREEGETNERPTVDAIGKILASAVASFPALKDATFVEARAGVRPGTESESPLLGPVPGRQGLEIATRHSHAGIMLSPGTAELMAEYVNTGDERPLANFAVRESKLPS